MSKNTLIFDFDGTLVDTFSMFVKTFSRIKIEFGYEKTEMKPLSYYRDRGLKQLIKEYNISRFKLPQIIKRTQKEVDKSRGDIKFFPSIQEVLRQLKDENVQLGILSSSPREMIVNFLDEDSRKLFDFIYGGVSLFGKHQKLNKLLKKEGLDKKETLYFGDQVRDVEACKKIGLDICAVTWGFNSKKLLIEHNPEFIIDQPSEILDAAG